MPQNPDPSCVESTTISPPEFFDIFHVPHWLWLLFFLFLLVRLFALELFGVVLPISLSFLLL